MAQWPEPTPEPGENTRRLKIGAIAAVAALLAWVALHDDRSSLFSFRMPEISLPDVSMPNVSMPDLRGRGSAPATEGPETTASVAEPPFTYAGGPSLQSVPFQTCSAMLDDFPASMGDAIVVEDDADRRIRRYKFLEGTLTVTCSRADNTLRIEQGA